MGEQGLSGADKEWIRAEVREQINAFKDWVREEVRQQLARK
jgi:hypothetical protein